MIDKDLKRRAERLVRGEFRVDDLDRLFLAQRDRAHGRESIREVGDFVAHRDERVKGPVTQVVRDVFASAHVWLQRMLRNFASLKDIRRAADANLRLASDEQIADGCGLKRSAARQTLRKLERGAPLSQREVTVAEYFGNRFIWKSAFTDHGFFDDLGYVLVASGVLSATKAAALDKAWTFITLYTIALMHGCAVVLSDDSRVELFAGYANRQGKLEVKARIVIAGAPKPIFLPLCVFWTDLDPGGHCEPALLDDQSAWLEPIELRANGTLSALG